MTVAITASSTLDDLELAHDEAIAMFHQGDLLEQLNVVLTLD